MAAPQNFRSAFNGFNREDVARYLEYLNAKHTAQLNELTSEAEFLRTKLAALQEAPEQQEAVSALEQERDELKAQVEALQARCAELEEALSAPAQEEVHSVNEELEAYRRAERMERLAKERAELIYHQANGVLAEAAAKVDCVTAEIGPMADQVMTQLSQLQLSISGSKRALQDAVSIMNTIRPNP